MPPPSVKCEVCGEVVLKSKTVCIGMNSAGPIRVCKTHDMAAGAEEWKRVKEDERKGKEEARKLQEQRRNQRWAPPRLDYHCQVCSKSAITEREFWGRLLVEMTRLELTGSWSFVDVLNGKLAVQVRKELEALGKVVALQVPLTVEQCTLVWRSEADVGVKETASLFRVLIACPECLKKIGIPIPQPPSPTMEQLQKMAPVTAVVVEAIKEEIRQNN